MTWHPIFYVTESKNYQTAILYGPDPKMNKNGEKGKNLF